MEDDYTVDREPYPTEILRDKYVPLNDFCEENQLDESIIRELITNGKITRTEFRVGNSRRRCAHINPEEVWKELNK